MQRWFDAFDLVSTWEVLKLWFGILRGIVGSIYVVSILIMQGSQAVLPCAHTHSRVCSRRKLLKWVTGMELEPSSYAFVNPTTSREKQ